MRQVFVVSLLIATYFAGFTPFDSSAAELRLTKPEKVGMSSERLERIAIVMQKLIDEEKIPGTITLVARKGKLLPSGTYATEPLMKLTTYQSLID